MSLRITISLITVFLLLGCQEESVPGPKTFATADIVLVDTEDGEFYQAGERIGGATFTYQDGVTSLEVSLANREPGSSHAMHLHQGTLEEPGRHWNQGKFVSFCGEKSLGDFWIKPFAGDVGNIEIDEDGNGFFFMRTDLWSIGTNDDKDILGTVIFVHQNFEDFGNECDPFHTHEHGDHMNPKIAGGTVLLTVEQL